MLLAGFCHRVFESNEIAGQRVNLAERHRMKLDGIEFLIVAVAERDHQLFHRLQVLNADALGGNFRPAHKRRYLGRQLADRLVRGEFAHEDFELGMDLFRDVAHIKMFY
jgi:hypothetical protein